MKSLLQIARRMMVTGMVFALGGQVLYAQDTAETVYDYAFAHHEQEMTRCETCSPEQFAEKTYKIGFILEGLGHPHLVALKADAEAVAAKYPNIQLMVRAGGDDLAKQSADAEELLAQGVDALIIQSANAQMLKGVLEQADAMNVPYFFCLKGIKGTNAVSHALAGYSIEGKMMGDYIAQTFPDGGNAVIIEGIPGDESNTSRTGQFVKALAANPKWKILASRPGMYRQEPAMKVMEGVLTEFPDINLVYGANDANALGALRVIREAGLAGQIKVIGIDAEKAALAAIKKGEMFATATHGKGGARGRTLAGVTMNIIVDYFNGKDVPRWFVSQTELVTRENVDQIEPLF